jgi:ADP-heptose:LPS heptosyltransferase
MSTASKVSTMEQFCGGAQGTSGRLALIRLRSLGDTVLMTPLAAVVKRVPGWEVAAVVEAPFHEVLLDNPHINRLLVVPRTKNRLRARLRTTLELRGFKPDVVVDLHGGTTSAIMTRLSGAIRRVGYAGSPNSALYNVKVPDPRLVWGTEQLHTVEHQLALLKQLGFPVEPIPDPQVCVNLGDLAEVRHLLLLRGLSAGEYVLLHLAAAFETKQWDVEKFAELSRRLAGTGMSVAVTAGPGQEALLENFSALVKGLPGVQAVAPLPLTRFTALAALCRLYVGNDTGATHIAAALGRRIVVIFGSSDSRAWHPWGVEHRLIASDLPCIPCPGYHCLHFEAPLCIKSVPVEPVFQAIKELW